MEKSPVPEDLLKSFDSTVMIINELTAEAADIKIKYGDRSKLFQKKAAQVEALRDFYKRSKDYIEHLLAVSAKLGVDVIGMELQLLQEQSGVSFRQAAAILGYKFSEEHLQAQEKVDAIIAELRNPAGK